MNKESVHIIGGGIIGLCSAWYLVKEGYQVTIIDKGDFTDGTSHGNAGMIVPSHFEPMATPGIITQGLKWLLDSKSPFYVKPRLNADLIQWLYIFYRSANKNHVERSIPHLYKLNEYSRELYAQIAEEENFDFDYEEKGLLMLFKSKKQKQKEEELATKAHQLGVEAQILNDQELRKLEPNLELDVEGGLYFPGDAHLHPNKLIDRMKNKLIKSGVNFVPNTMITDFKVSSSKIKELVTSTGENIGVERVLIASGSWSAEILKKLKFKMLLQFGKGYSMTHKNDQGLMIPTILTEAKVAITPMGDDLRISGTMEINGYSTKINKSRVQGILESLPKYYPQMSIADTPESKIWQGYRPCTPDGLPYIGRDKKISNLTIGTGHGMMGLSLGAVSGKLLSEIISNKKTSLDIDVYNPNRF